LAHFLELTRPINQHQNVNNEIYTFMPIGMDILHNDPNKDR